MCLVRGQSTDSKGQKRVRMERGWVSLTSKTGRPICVVEADVQLLLQSVPLLKSLKHKDRDTIATQLQVCALVSGLATTVFAETVNLPDAMNG